MNPNATPIVGFYPISFEIDMNGKNMIWQGVVLLPFINKKQPLNWTSLLNPRGTLALPSPSSHNPRSVLAQSPGYHVPRRRPTIPGMSLPDPRGVPALPSLTIVLQSLGCSRSTPGAPLLYHPSPSPAVSTAFILNITLHY
jgi:hypothetical protein